MAARIALVGLAEGTVLAVRAALGAGAVRVCKPGAVPAGTALVIVEAESPGFGDDLGLTEPATPVLVLADWNASRTVALGDRRFDILEKPFGSADLREKVRDLLEPGPVIPAGPTSIVCPEAGYTSWLDEPLIEASVARTLAGAGRLGGSAWIVGEPGTGTDLVAAALARAFDAGREPIVWQEEEPLAVALPRLDDAARVLWAPAIDDRPAHEQKAFERLLALDPKRRIVATSGDDPERAVAAGRLSETLVASLSRLSVRLAPLRERRADLPGLALTLAGSIAQRLAPGTLVTFTDHAKRILEAHAWPYNLVELESVLTRTIAAKNWDPVPISRDRDRGAMFEIDADDLQFAPMHLAPLFTDAGTRSEAETTATREIETAPPRRGVVVALGDVAAARAASAAPAVEAPVATPPPAASDEDVSIEGVLAGFAHDIRNPMSTIKTFAGLEASREGSETAELARLAAQACERVDEHLELLQRYSEIGDASPAVVDLVEILGEAVEAAGAEDDLVISARRSLTVSADPALTRLIADAIVAECRARRAPESGDEPSTADIGSAGAPGMAAMELAIPTGRAAVDRLDKWVAGKRFPWRLALARDAARRSGGALEVDVEEGQIRLAWRLPAAGETAGSQGERPAARSGEPVRAPIAVVEEGKDDDQAGSPDRRRRSRSS